MRELEQHQTLLKPGAEYPESSPTAPETDWVLTHLWRSCLSLNTYVVSKVTGVPLVFPHHGGHKNYFRHVCFYAEPRTQASSFCLWSLLPWWKAILALYLGSSWLHSYYHDFSQWNVFIHTVMPHLRWELIWVNCLRETLCRSSPSGRSQKKSLEPVRSHTALPA